MLIPIDLNDSPRVIAGLVPAIPIRVARLCPHKRDGRDKPGHDELRGFASKWPGPGLGFRFRSSPHLAARSMRTSGSGH